MPAATVSTKVAVVYTVNRGLTRTLSWFHGSGGTTEIHQDDQGSPSPQTGGESPAAQYHRHNLYLGPGPSSTICIVMYRASMPLGTRSPSYDGSCLL